MKRPPLTTSTSLADFRARYWLKSDLVGFCRKQRISPAGGKLDIAERIECFLQTGKVVRGRKVRRLIAARPMPVHFTRETIVGKGWRCTTALRSFFEREIGPSFHFNAAMRDFIHGGVGKPLSRGIAVWEKAQRKPKGSTTIGPQFEFNRHMRAYFRENPGRSHTDAIAAWKKEKAMRSKRRRKHV